jgi:predicted nucleic acid-binding protein
VIFVDTSFFVALMDPRDGNHHRAVEAFQPLRGQRLNETLLTTNNVVLEAITVTRYEVGHGLAVTTAETLYHQPADSCDGARGGPQVIVGLERHHRVAAQAS